MSAKSASFVVLLAILLLSHPALGQVTPSLTVYDAQGVPYTAVANSTVFPTIPGAYFFIELPGTENAFY